MLQAWSIKQTAAEYVNYCYANEAYPTTYTVGFIGSLNVSQVSCFNHFCAHETIIFHSLSFL